jgi:hypothetical protein
VFGWVAGKRWLDRVSGRRERGAEKNFLEEAEMAETIRDILEAMQASHEGFLARLLDWRAAGGKLPEYKGAETFEDLINRERLAVSRCKMAVEHFREHETRVV